MALTWNGFSGFHAIYATEITTILLMLLFLLSRLATLFSPRPRLIRPSDLCSFLFLVVTTALTLTQNGLTLIVLAKYIRLFEASPDGNFVSVQTTEENKKVFVQLLCHTVSVWCLKGCYLAQFGGMYRVFPTKVVKGVFWATLGFTVAGWAVSMGLWVGWCRPFSLNWNYVPGTHHCAVQSSMPILLATTCLNLTADLLIAVLSLLLLRSSHPPGTTSPALRTAIVIVFLIGLLSIAAPAGRYAVMNYMYAAGLSQEERSRRITDDMVTWSRVLARMEVVGGTVAYGCAFGRVVLRRVVGGVVGLARSWSSAGSRGSGSTGGSGVGKEGAWKRREGEKGERDLDWPGV